MTVGFFHLDSWSPSRQSLAPSVFDLFTKPVARDSAFQLRPLDLIIQANTMPPFAPPTSLDQPTATYTNVTAYNPSSASASPPVVKSAFGRHSEFPSNISLGPRDGSPGPIFPINSTAVESTPPTDTITIEPSEYATETGNGRDPTAVS